MNLKVVLFAWCLCSLLAPQVQAEEITPNDFAYGYELTTSIQSSIYDVDLPAEVYETVTREGLGDLRVFNVDADIIPHQVIAAEIKKVKEAIYPPVRLSLFPLKGIEKTAIDLSQVRIETTENGAIVEVNRKQENVNIPSQKILAYFVDASNVEHVLDHFLLGINNQGPQGYFRKINLEASSDLKNWQSVERGAVIADLEFQGERLVKNTIALHRRKEKYYRLTWKAEDGELRLNSLQGISPTKTVEKNDKLEWKIVAGKKSEEKEERAYYYDLEGHFPISQLRLRFPYDNSIARLSLEASHKEDGPWRHQSSGTLYRISKDDTTLENNLIKVGSKRFRYWRIKITSGIEGLGKKIPQLEFGWTPEKLRFLARGTPPFLLAFGSSKVEPYSGMNLKVKAWSEQVASAGIGPKQTLGGAEMLTYVPPKAHPWKSWILWGVLILGVISMGGMAFKLLQTMKEENP